MCLVGSQKTKTFLGIIVEGMMFFCDGSPQRSNCKDLFGLTIWFTPGFEYQNLVCSSLFRCSDILFHRNWVQIFSEKIHENCFMDHGFLQRYSFGLRRFPCFHGLILYNLATQIEVCVGSSTLREFNQKGENQKPKIHGTGIFTD